MLWICSARKKKSVGARSHPLQAAGDDLFKGKSLLKKDGSSLAASTALRNNRLICIYFAAQWCPALPHVHTNAGRRLPRGQGGIPSHRGTYSPLLYRVYPCSPNSTMGAPFERSFGFVPSSFFT
ncbi:hypothetical protein HPB48_015342 [Haemaphysalis longicornis]|uniref:Uncharacterized protein n=1 Tax=Haemaphysalis longicornis TaxID=44386 RepID=A0A9J6GV04_HAELO|nr:hypothetical protein HPB48_015342 [Haemaphysalis longicornis]